MATAFQKKAIMKLVSDVLTKKVRAWLRGLVTQILHSSTQIISNESVYGINSVMCFTLLYLPNINQNID